MTKISFLHHLLNRLICTSNIMFVSVCPFVLFSFLDHTSRSCYANCGYAPVDIFERVATPLPPRKSPKIQELLHFHSFLVEFANRPSPTPTPIQRGSYIFADIQPHFIKPYTINVFQKCQELSRKLKPKAPIEVVLLLQILRRWRFGFFNKCS